MTKCLVRLSIRIIVMYLALYIPLALLALGGGLPVVILLAAGIIGGAILGTWFGRVQARWDWEDGEI